MAGESAGRDEGAAAPGGDGGVVGRLGAARYVLLGFIGLLTILVAAGALALHTAALLFFAVTLMIAALPRGERLVPRRLAQRAPPSVWPETGLKQMADALPDPCVILDRRGFVRYQNHLAEAAFPIRPGDPLTFRLRAPDLLRAYERVAAGGAAERLEFVERVPTERWYDAWFSPIETRDDHGRGGFIMLLFSDKTEQRRAERVRVDFVANASHELRTPLASLAGFIETLQGPARDDAVARERFLGIMHEQATRMSRLIDDLLSLSRVEMKAHMRPEAPVDLAAVLRGVVDAMEPLAREQQVAIESRLPDAPMVIAGDRDELVQVFQNLVENACKYGRSGGRVVVELEPGDAGEGPRATVKDFGPGIAAEHLPRLTERFYRADEAASSTRGTGLGLAIVKHILNRHRARLVIESQPGEGAAFIVEFAGVTIVPKRIDSTKA
ncbi:two-component system, OmpR family, phosphate regulon sensor histidine kinase PhoR [Kaistia soli DSM 19436]|uniref:histidine kinase n=1 Tax=Kaistia soli DSM 19436 TaxID=1122133 RepID=A0A1M5MCJ8_9HYPH|nr:ATP-binding protein [Kaistia soli]SHG74961.1 two-component system, OmpR family, phosphate regulon sensor histidine kinase PhoR [Kaistia soli DSM 19436]